MASFKHCQRHIGPKALSAFTRSTPFIQSRSFHKSWILCQISAWFKFCVNENVPRQITEENEHFLAIWTILDKKRYLRYLLSTDYDMPLLLEKTWELVMFEIVTQLGVETAFTGCKASSFDKIPFATPLFPRRSRCRSPPSPLRKERKTTGFWRPRGTDNWGAAYLRGSPAYHCKMGMKG